MEETMHEQAKKYTPQPIDTSAVTLDADILALLEQLARHNHDVWAQQRLAQGWTYGPHRDDHARKHPGLVSYEDLSEQEKDYDRQTAQEVLKAMIALGYEVRKRPGPRSG
jgi:hypothetical protein